jgi:dUTP pyrophosphatase
VIDSDYRGEVRVVLVNHGGQEFRIEAGDRIAQLLVQRVERPAYERVADLDPTARGAGGFGSTGA